MVELVYNMYSTEILFKLYVDTYLLRTTIKYYEDLGNFQKIQYAVKQHYF